MASDDGRGGGPRQPESGGHLADETLSGLVDGDLPAADRAAAEGHLAACAACRRQLDALRSTVVLLRALPTPTPTRSFELGPAHERRPAGWRRLADRLIPALPALRAAAVALVLALGGLTALDAWRDDPSDSVGDRAEPAVSRDGALAAPTLAVAGDPTEQGPADAEVVAPEVTVPPTPPSDDAQSRSAEPAAAQAAATTTPRPTSPPADDLAQRPAAAEAATRTPPPDPTETLATESILVAEEAAAASGLAGESEAAVDAEGADEEAPGSGGAADADEADAAIADSADADEDAPKSAAGIVVEETATPVPRTTPGSPTAAPLVATPAGSPAASPVASPVAASGTRQAFRGDGGDRSLRVIGTSVALAAGALGLGLLTVSRTGLPHVHCGRGTVPRGSALRYRPRGRPGIAGTRSRT